MSDEKKGASLPAPAEVAAPRSAKAEPKVYKYVGPDNNEAVIRMPGDPQTYHPQDLPQRHIPFYIESTPQNKNWWE